MKPVQLPADLELRTRSICDAVRPVLFYTDLVEFRLATYGGTVFIVKFCGRLYGLTCKHVFKDFPKDNLFITHHLNEKGQKSAPIKTLGFASPKGEQRGRTWTIFV
jgi:hypothetical protein